MTVYRWLDSELQGSEEEIGLGGNALGIDTRSRSSRGSSSSSSGGVSSNTYATLLAAVQALVVAEGATATSSTSSSSRSSSTSSSSGSSSSSSSSSSTSVDGEKLIQPQAQSLAQSPSWRAVVKVKEEDRWVKISDLDPSVTATILSKTSASKISKAPNNKAGKCSSGSGGEELMGIGQRVVIEW